MTEQQDPRRQQYERARTAFEDLSFEDRALFLVQEAVSTVIHGIEQAGRVLVGELDAFFSEVEVEAAQAAAEAEEAKAKAEAARARAEAETAAKTTAKKATPKKNSTPRTKKTSTTGTAKKTPRKSPPKKKGGDSGDAA